MAWGATECAALAERALAADQGRWAHVCAVASRMLRLAPPEHGDDMLIAAAWLHDIGYAPGLRHAGMHAIDGALYLRRLGAPERLVSLVAHHTGAEVEAEERSLGAALSAFSRPPQGELDLLTLADLTAGPTGEAVSVGQRLEEILQRYEPDHPVHRAVSRSRVGLEASARRAAKLASDPS